MRTVDKRETMEEDLHCILIESHTFCQPSSQKESGLSAGVLPVPLPCLVSKVNIRWHSIRRRMYQLTVAALMSFNLYSNHAFFTSVSVGQLRVGGTRKDWAGQLYLKLWMHLALALTAVWLVSTPQRIHSKAHT